MPKTRRSGRKYQLRKILASHYAPGHLNPYLGIESSVADLLAPIPLVESTANREYTLTPIECEPLPRLPSLDIPRLDRDPRIAYYSLLRQALLHYHYGGATPATRFHWPATCSGYDKIRQVVHSALKEAQDPPLIELE